MPLTQEGEEVVSAPGTRLISVVDDDDSVREATASLLRSFGFSVKEFASAEQFLDSPFLGKTACLILDVRMPGMSGAELQRQLASERRRVPIIFITAHDDQAMQAKVMRGGAIDFLRKPFSEEALFRAVYSGLGNPAGNQDFQVR